ncbi:unnamed protein product [Schistosoma mansoni]|nr:unnamed protein product [Schistosoma mansoni]|eukprot:XP_018644665.1 unnamed protein product [Schistosoma mansoni]
MTQEFGLPFQSRLSASLACDGEGDRNIHTFVDAKWIKSGTLVEYEVSGDCPKHDSMEICQESKTSNTKCMWYEKANMCIVSTDKDIDDFKVNSCQIGNSSNVHVSITPIVVEEATTTPRISESDNGHGKSNHFLHIVIPVVICFLVVCSGCVICLLLYRKKKCMPSLS